MEMGSRFTGVYWSGEQCQHLADRDLSFASSSSPHFFCYFCLFGMSDPSTINFNVSLTHILEVSPFHFVNLWQLHFLRNLVARSQTSYMGVSERTPM